MTFIPCHGGRQKAAPTSPEAPISLWLVRNRRNERCLKEPMMPQISESEFERLPLRVHEFLAGVPLHDVWAVDLPKLRAGTTLEDFLRLTDASLFTPSPAVR